MNKKVTWPLSLAYAVWASGCSTVTPLPHSTASHSLPLSSWSAPMHPTMPGEGSPGVLDTGPLSFPALVRLATEQNPDIRVAQAQAEAARGKMIQAGLYPNPTIGWEASEIGNTPESAAGMQGPTFGFTLVTADKLGLAQSAAVHAVAAADWQATTRWYATLVKLRIAYYDTLAAQQEVRVGAELVRIAEEGFSAAEKLEKSGAGGRPDVLRARVELEQYRNRLEVSQRRAESAWARLAAAIGVTDLPVRPLQGALQESPPEFTLSDLKAAMLARSSELQAAQAEVMEAQQSLRLAQAEVVPNVAVQLRPLYDFGEKRAGGDVNVSMPVPLFNQNQGNIRAAHAQMTRAQEMVRQTEIRLIERLNVAYQEYAAARRQAENFDQRILPTAQESLRLILLGYTAGDPKYDYTAVLQAQNALTQARLTQVQVLNDLQRSISEIEGLIQRGLDGFAPPPAAVPMPQEHQKPSAAPGR